MALVLIVLAPKENNYIPLPIRLYPFISIPSFWVSHFFILSEVSQMVSTRRSSVPKTIEKTRVFLNNNQETGKGSSEETGEAVAENYEQKRALRMQENMERLKKLGLFELSKNLKNAVSPKKRKMMKKPAANGGSSPPRRSSRLKDMVPVSYVEKKAPKGEKVRKFKELSIGIGTNPEIYTEEHEKLLGDSKTPWNLSVDGYDESGVRIYDPVEGKSCHQCRQKTLGRRTKCSKCNGCIGQLCGDCLYMRYGENVIEVNENPDWICPACRDICNCSRCRRSKGWVPTGAIYNQVHARGFKSVAHYLVKAFRAERKTGEEGNETMFPSLEELAADKTNEANGVASNDHDDKDDELFVMDDDHVSDSETDDDHVADSEMDD